ncbi:hypothetical protein CVT24_008175 [Panaeolus cyanescens]|uniref:Casein kinase substrate phosphoprotein PP28 domain-containing protein n=1 Tax=Panaeolus cyanescens TaxID=181874 RepID=A0A409VFJ5_9AGAR|nr:hypothetical protein CVT24_008175 [Panaeolus cyanescens]
MVRGTGKFKQKRGGGRSFRGEVEGIDEDSEEDSEESEEEDSEEESEEESEDEKKPQVEMTRAERRDLKKKEAAARAAKKTGGAGPSKGNDDDDDDDDEDLINPNHVQKKLTFKDLDAAPQLSRREREAKEKEEARLRYQKLHLAGKTDEAKNDMARLAKIRAEREAAQAKRKAEAEAKAKEVEEKRQAQMAKRK